MLGPERNFYLEFRGSELYFSSGANGYGLSPLRSGLRTMTCFIKNLLRDAREQAQTLHQLPAADISAHCDDV